METVPRDVHHIKSQIVVDSRFDDLIGNLKNVHLPYDPIDVDYSGHYDAVPCGRVTKMEDDSTYNLNYNNGIEIMNDDNVAICAYDESIVAYGALEGQAICTSHALIYVCKEDYLPVTYVTLKFFTRSETVANALGNSAIVTNNPSRSSSISTAKDKMNFLSEYCVDGSILLIDGPLIAGDGYTTFIQYVDDFCRRDILSIFFVKNSNSNMVIDNNRELSPKYNSDMHWSGDILKPGQRTSFFQYVDIHNPNNSKVFCYLKFYDNVSPVRVEFPTKVFQKYRNLASKMIDLAYYLLLVQGDKKNPQLRPIAVAEKYARETIKVIDVNREMRRAGGLTKTMNEGRWGNL